MSDPGLLEALLAAVPDRPEHVDARGVLLEKPELHGDRDGCVAVRPGRRLLVALGRPHRDAFAAALRDVHPEAELVAAGEAVAAASRHLGVAGDLAYVHSPGSAGLPARLAGAAGVLLDAGVLFDAGASLDRFSDEIRHEIAGLAGRFPVGAGVVDGRPVAVCYPAVSTERHWDVSVETLEGHRRRGYAEAAFHRLVPEMAARGLEPVWGALASNAASLGLAAKLGFVRVGEIVVFSLGGR
jgi:GNAT superfamily N-acetyltransferase